MNWTLKNRENYLLSLFTDVMYPCWIKALSSIERNITDHKPLNASVNKAHESIQYINNIIIIKMHKVNHLKINKTLIKIKYLNSLPAHHVTINWHQRAMNMQMFW